jgi:phage gp36-like protein
MPESTTPYCTPEDIFVRFGKDNVLRWADLNANADEAEIDDVIEAIIHYASRSIDDSLRGGVVEVPFVIVPTQIMNIAASKAGMLLYGNAAAFSEVLDIKMSKREKECSSLLTKIKSGHLRLDTNYAYNLTPGVFDD